MARDHRILNEIIENTDPFKIIDKLNFWSKSYNNFDNTMSVCVSVVFQNLPETQRKEWD